MSASSTQTKTNLSDSSRSAAVKTIQPRSASSYTTVSRAISEDAAAPLVSRWSPDSSSIATRSAGNTEAGPSGGSQELRNNPSSDLGDASAVSRYSEASSWTSDDGSGANVAAARAQSLYALEHGGPPAPATERIAENFSQDLSNNIIAGKQLSSSGKSAQWQRGKRS